MQNAPFLYAEILFALDAGDNFPTQTLTDANNQRDRVDAVLFPRALGTLSTDTDPKVHEVIQRRDAELALLNTLYTNAATSRSPVTPGGCDPDHLPDGVTNDHRQALNNIVTAIIASTHGERIASADSMLEFVVRGPLAIPKHYTPTYYVVGASYFDRAAFRPLVPSTDYTLDGMRGVEQVMPPSISIDEAKQMIRGIQNFNISIGLLCTHLLADGRQGNARQPVWFGSAVDNLSVAPIGSPGHQLLTLAVHFGLMYMCSNDIRPGNALLGRFRQIAAMTRDGLSYSERIGYVVCGSISGERVSSIYSQPAEVIPAGLMYPNGTLEDPVTQVTRVARDMALHMKAINTPLLSSTDERSLRIGAIHDVPLVVSLIKQQQAITEVIQDALRVIVPAINQIVLTSMQGDVLDEPPPSPNGIVISQSALFTSIPIKTIAQIRSSLYTIGTVVEQFNVDHAPVNPYIDDESRIELNHMNSITGNADIATFIVGGRRHLRLLAAKHTDDVETIARARINSTTSSNLQSANNAITDRNTNVMLSEMKIAINHRVQGGGNPFSIEHGGAVFDKAIHDYMELINQICAIYVTMAQSIAEIRPDDMNAQLQSVISGIDELKQKVDEAFEAIRGTSQLAQVVPSYKEHFDSIRAHVSDILRTPPPPSASVGNRSAALAESKNEVQRLLNTEKDRGNALRGATAALLKAFIGVHDGVDVKGDAERVPNNAVANEIVLHPAEDLRPTFPLSPSYVNNLRHRSEQARSADHLLATIARSNDSALIRKLFVIRKEESGTDAYDAAVASYARECYTRFSSGITPALVRMRNYITNSSRYSRNGILASIAAATASISNFNSCLSMSAAYRYQQHASLVTLRVDENTFPLQWIPPFVDIDRTARETAMTNLLKTVTSTLLSTLQPYGIRHLQSANPQTPSDLIDTLLERIPSFYNRADQILEGRVFGIHVDVIPPPAAPRPNNPAPVFVANEAIPIVARGNVPHRVADFEESDDEFDDWNNLRDIDRYREMAMEVTSWRHAVDVIAELNLFSEDVNDDRYQRRSLARQQTRDATINTERGARNGNRTERWRARLRNFDDNVRREIARVVADAAARRTAAPREQNRSDTRRATLRSALSVIDALKQRVSGLKRGEYRIAARRVQQQPGADNKIFEWNQRVAINQSTLNAAAQRQQAATAAAQQRLTATLNARREFEQARLNHATAKDKALAAIGVQKFLLTHLQSSQASALAREIAVQRAIESVFQLQLAGAKTISDQVNGISRSAREFAKVLRDEYSAQINTLVDRQQEYSRRLNAELERANTTLKNRRDELLDINKFAQERERNAINRDNKAASVEQQAYGLSARVNAQLANDVVRVGVADTQRIQADNTMRVNATNAANATVASIAGMSARAGIAAAGLNLNSEIAAAKLRLMGDTAALQAAGSRNRASERAAIPGTMYGPGGITGLTSGHFGVVSPAIDTILEFIKLVSGFSGIALTKLFDETHLREGRFAQLIRQDIGLAAPSVDRIRAAASNSVAMISGVQQQLSDASDHIEARIDGMLSILNPSVGIAKDRMDSIHRRVLNQSNAFADRLQRYRANVQREATYADDLFDSMLDAYTNVLMAHELATASADQTHRMNVDNAGDAIVSFIDAGTKDSAELKTLRDTALRIAADAGAGTRGMFTRNGLFAQVAQNMTALGNTIPRIDDPQLKARAERMASVLSATATAYNQPAAHGSSALSARDHLEVALRAKDMYSIVDDQKLFQQARDSPGDVVATFSALATRHEELMRHLQDAHSKLEHGAKADDATSLEITRLNRETARRNGDPSSFELSGPLPDSEIPAWVHQMRTYGGFERFCTYLMEYRLAAQLKKLKDLFLPASPAPICNMTKVPLYDLLHSKLTSTVIAEYIANQLVLNNKNHYGILTDVVLSDTNQTLSLIIQFLTRINTRTRTWSPNDPIPADAAFKDPFSIKPVEMQGW